MSQSQPPNGGAADMLGGAARVFLKPILPLLDNPSITEIMINGPAKIYIEQAGKVEKTAMAFPDARSLESAANMICQAVGKKLSRETPRVDARLPDGSRVHIVGPPAYRDGISITIRRFPAKPLTGDDLVRFGAITPTVMRFLAVCIEMHLNIMVAGGTGSGKTSLLNVLSAYMPAHERILVIEDTAELQINHGHVVGLEARPPDEKGRGQITIRELFHSALRMRPDRIIIGEIRAGEALDLVQAMTSGHSGALGTVHATTPRDVLTRMETLCLYADSGLPLTAIRSQISSALNLLVLTGRLRDGTRKVTEVAEVLPLGTDGNYRTQSLFTFNIHGIDPAGKVVGQLVATGAVPSFLQDAQRQGYQIPSSLFHAPAS